MVAQEIYKQIEPYGVWFSVEDIESFMSLDLPKKPVILELGTGHGRSTRAMRLIWPQADIHTCDPGVQCKPEELDATFYPEAGRDLPWDKKIDLLFVDDDHVRDTVIEDINKFKPFIKKNGYIVFHDYYETGVKEAIDKVGLKVKAKKTGDYSQAIWRNTWA